MATGKKLSRSIDLNSVEPPDPDSGYNFNETPALDPGAVQSPGQTAMNDPVELTFSKKNPPGQNGAGYCDSNV